ncbi:hypothetical protein EON81_23725 [bacterium]|nr:MAG: hypothetical protein EON81_23725 [bacterium]
MASYARYERLGASALPKPEPGPLDPPATKSSRLSLLRERKGWALLSTLCAALALASYEQAVMLPACLLGVAVAFRLQGRLPRWSWQISFWALLVGYLVLRSIVVPRDVSGYQAQQFRSGAGVWLDLSEYVFYPLGTMLSLWATLSVGFFVLINWQPWGYLLSFLQGLGAFWEARRDWRWPLTGWALSLLAFLPMAWLKLFEHYHWWPMTLRTIFVVGLASALGKGIVSAWSRPERQAPSRPDPAPGSLPRP